MSLLRLCCAGRPKRIAFTSSISTTLGPLSPSLIPESPLGPDPAVALPTGYAQSKYIIERILQTASKPSGLGISIHLLRVGQLCGSTRTGKWNRDEWVPILLATSKHMGALPLLERRAVDWVPVDVAASTITELLLPDKASSPVTYEVHNIVNPHPIPWSTFLSLLQSSSLSLDSSKLDEVSMAEWVRRLNVLADDGADVEAAPGLRLLSFWESMVRESESKVFDTVKTREMSESLRTLGPFCREWLEANLNALRNAE
jgi:thioester reductase-like protein